MEIFCLKCKKKTDTINLTKNITKNNRNQIKGQCKICNTNKCQFIDKDGFRHPKKVGGENTPHFKKINTKFLPLEEVYYNTKTGYCGINELQRKTGKLQKEIKEFLNQQDTYTLHKPARKNYRTERVYVHNIDEQWQSDLVEMIPYAEENDNFKYLLTVIDCFSKYSQAIPIKNKNADEVVKAFEILFKNRKPRKIQTDKGKEYYNAKLNKLFRDNNIIHFSTESDKKASIVERFNRTIKEKMWKIFTENNNHKWINITDDLLINYNNSYHRSIKMTPSEASKKEYKNIVYKNLFPENDINFKLINAKFNINDKVRITKYKTIFDKGYLPNWTAETFVINKVFKTKPTTYQLKDLADEIIKGKYYDEELILYNNKNNAYEVEKILKRRTRNGIVL